MVNRLKPLYGDEIVDIYRFIKEIPLITMTHPELLASCLTNEYTCLGLMSEENLEGFIIYRLTGFDLFVVGLWCKNNVKKFIPVFYEFAKEIGAKKVKGLNMRNDKAYAKLMGMEKVYTLFEREV